MASDLTPAALRNLNEVPASWTKARLADVAEVFDCPHSTPTLTTSGAYMVRTQDVRSGVVRLNELARVSHDTYMDRIKRAVPREGDLLYSREGTYFGIAAEVPPDVSICLGQRMVHLRPKSQLNHKFLKHWLNSPLMARHIAGLRDGSVAERLNMSTIRTLPVAFPKMDEQKRVVEVLGVLDNRAELLRETNVTLEAIAQALFKAWFVDFDPVRAKAEGRELEGVDAATAALFPSEFEGSELGSIPKGWRVSSVGTVAELIKGCSYKGTGLSETGGAHMFNLGCFNTKRVFATENIKRYTGSYRERQAVVEGDLIMANTDMTQQREILGRALFVPAGSAPGFVSHHVFKVAVRRDNSDGWKRFLFFAFQQSAFRERAVGHATGTTVLALARDSAEQCPIVEPDGSVLVAFNAMVAPVLARIASNLDQTKNLVALRDTLLPRLISGKLRLPEAESMLKEATA